MYRRRHDDDQPDHPSTTTLSQQADCHLYTFNSTFYLVPTPPDSTHMINTSCAPLSQHLTLYYASNTSTNTITFALRFSKSEIDLNRTWIALGISEKGGMVGSDISMLRSRISLNYERLKTLMNESKNETITEEESKRKVVDERWPEGKEVGGFAMVDMFAREYAYPKRDSLRGQNVELLHAPMDVSNGAGSQREEEGYFVFQRPLLLNSTCRNDATQQQQEDWDILSGKEQHVIWAYGSFHDDTGRPAKHRHGQHGQVTLVLNPDAKSPIQRQREESVKVLEALEKDGALKTLELRMGNVSVPTVTNEGMSGLVCQKLRLPNGKKHHALKFEPIVDSHLTHHYMVYTCDTPHPDSFNIPAYSPTSNPPNTDTDCSETYTRCTRILVGFAKGQPMIYPPNVGLSFGLQGKTDVILQIHYDNHHQTSGIVDSSGIRIFYVDEPTLLRKHEVGLLLLGSLNIQIPGNERGETVVESYCPSVCTGKYFKEPVTLLANMLHMHSLGSSMFTKVIRDGEMVKDVGVTRFYDEGFQDFEFLEPGTILQPGDVLHTKCVFKPTLGIRNVTTMAGQTSDSEMCQSFMQYYPATDQWDVCMNLNSDTSVICNTGTFAGATEQNLISGHVYPSAPISYHEPSFGSGVCGANESMEVSVGVPIEIKVETDAMEEEGGSIFLGGPVVGLFGIFGLMVVFFGLVLYVTSPSRAKKREGLRRMEKAQYEEEEEDEEEGQGSRVVGVMEIDGRYARVEEEEDVSYSSPFRLEDDDEDDGRFEDVRIRD
ncbi:hypothetical protein HDV05_007169 [Chytridiales sp. JEL 0842]|nr:hypothetical protein HDV05_007169 [Chytridiales sp. JEL 0842]